MSCSFCPFTLKETSLLDGATARKQDGSRHRQAVLFPREGHLSVAGSTPEPKLWQSIH